MPKRTVNRKMEFVAAAQALFEEKGFENTSIDDIVSRLGVAKGLFYYYFESKEMLLDQIMDHLMNEIGSSITAAMEKKGLSAPERFIEIFKAGADVTSRSLTIIRYFHVVRNQAFHLAMEKQAVGMMIPALEKIILQGNEEGVFNALYPRETAGAILFSLRGVRVIGPREMTPEQVTYTNQAQQYLAERMLGAAPGTLAALKELLPLEIKMFRSCSSEEE